MNTYLIIYDLVKVRDYEPLYKAIKSYKTWAHITESTWAIVTTEKASQVRDNLLSKMDQDDRIFVIRSGTEGAWRNVLCTSEWLKTNL